MKQNEDFESYFPKVSIVKAYKKVLNRSIEEGTFMINHDGEVLNSKTEWNQQRIIRTTIVQGGAEMVGGQVLPFQRDGGGRAGGNRTAGQHGRGGEEGRAEGQRTEGQQGREGEGGRAGGHMTGGQQAWGERAGDQLTARAKRLHVRTSD